MISLRKCQLLSVLILVFICVPTLATEPNETETELKFETSTRLGSKGLMKFTGPVEPKYVAVFSMSDLSRIWYSFDVHRDYLALTKMILATPAGQSMSEIQKELLKADRVISTSTGFIEGQMYKPQKTEFGLYAFTIDDAKKMSRALIEILTEIAREKLPPLLDEFLNKRKQELQEYQERISDSKKKLAEKEPQLKSVESVYKKLKNTDSYSSFADVEAYEKAKETITQMNKMLSILDIELTGIREKLGIIEKYRESDQFSKATLEKLEQMFIEQVVELGGTEARKAAAVTLRDQGKHFCNYFDDWSSLKSEVSGLRSRLKSSENRVRNCEKMIVYPNPEFLPPKVLQNKVIIYPL